MKSRLGAFVILLVGGLSLSAAALYLRYTPGSPLRDWATTLLGHERRALTEHFLAGVGISISLTAAFILSWWFLEWLRPFVIRALSVLGCTPRNRVQPPTPSDLIGERVPLILACAFGAAYVMVSYQFEKSQELSSVYGGPQRGYFQVDQFAVDVAAAAAGVAIIFLSLRRFKR
jgi:hypothetical protein